MRVFHLCCLFIAAPLWWCCWYFHVWRHLIREVVTQTLIRMSGVFSQQQCILYSALYILENLWEWCLCQAFKSIFSPVWPWPLTPWLGLPTLGLGISGLPPSPSPPLPPFPPALPPSLSLGAPPTKPARGSGERCKLPHWGLGQSPSQQTIWCISAKRSSSDGNSLCAFS